VKGLVSTNIFRIIFVLCARILEPGKRFGASPARPARFHDKEGWLGHHEPRGVRIEIKAVLLLILNVIRKWREPNIYLVYLVYLGA
jgi:hypothetical protein